MRRFPCTLARICRSAYAQRDGGSRIPAPNLESIRAPLLAINSADDLINPPELGILERNVTRVPKGRAVVIPLSPDTRGHGTHTIAAVWEQYLSELLAASAR